MKSLSFLFLGYFCFCFSFCYAQESKHAGDFVILKEIETNLTKLDYLLFEEQTASIRKNKKLGADIKLTSVFCIDELVEAQKKAYNSKNGLTLQILYGNQIGLEVVDYFDEENNIYPYRNRAQLSVNWDITGSSLIGRKMAYKIFEIEALQKSYHLQKVAHKNSTQEQLFKSAKQWDVIISLVYLQRINLLNDILRLKKHLYSSHRVLYSDVASVQMEIFRVKSAIHSQDTLVEIEHWQAIDLDSYLSDLAMDTMGLFDTYMVNNHSLKHYPLEQELLKLNKKSLSYIKQVEVGIFTKAQYFGGGADIKSGGKFDIGISAKFPISREHKRKRSVISSEISMSRREQFNATRSAVIQYQKEVERLSHIDNKLEQNILILKSAAQNIVDYRLMHQNNLSSFESLLFEYDAYLVVLADIYLTIKEREMLIESLVGFS